MEKEKKTWKFFSWGTLWLVIVSCVLNGAIWIGFHGFPLTGVPEKEEVQSVTILYGEEERTVTGSEDIQLLVNACNLLSYRLLGKGEGEPAITVVYHLKDGGDVKAQANGSTVWWRGKAHAIKQEDLFVNILEGLFFSGEKQ